MGREVNSATASTSWASLVGGPLAAKISAHHGDIGSLRAGGPLAAS